MVRIFLVSVVVVWSPKVRSEFSKDRFGAFLKLKFLIFRISKRLLWTKIQNPNFWPKIGDELIMGHLWPYPDFPSMDTNHFGKPTSSSRSQSFDVTNNPNLSSSDDFVRVLVAIRTSSWRTVRHGPRPQTSSHQNMQNWSKIELL